MLNTIQKIGPILDLFTPDRPEWGITDIANALDMPKSSVHSVISTLASIELLIANGRGRYRPSSKLLALSDRMRTSLDFDRQASPVMRDVAKLTHEDAMLAVLDRCRVLYIGCAGGGHPTVRLATVRPGTYASARRTAAGKVLLADLEPRALQRLLVREQLLPRPAHTAGSDDGLRAELKRVRAAGMAYERSEWLPDVCSLAAPIRDSFGVVVAALTVNAPAYRFKVRLDLLRESVAGGAARVSESLGASPEAWPGASATGA